ncbi:MAG: hypothetical protein IT379_29475 [Deltaproteobacteria bacterium]|nr:hypothetical protein [Deltaproteobacteria bacterium]
MTVRDLGYRPYEGERLPASRNTWVLLRHGLARAWASWLVKLAIGVSIAIVLVVGAYTFVLSRIVAAISQMGSTQDLVGLCRSQYTWQIWFCVLLVSLGAGSGVIANDSRNRAFQFYFSKPVTPEQYLLGRTLPVSILCALITFAPAVIEIVVLITLAPTREESVSRVGLIFPALGFSALIGIVVGPLSVAASALAKSRALTMAAWAAFFVLPHLVAALTDGVVMLADRGSGRDAEGFPWLFLGSVPALLGYVGDALFRAPGVETAKVGWMHAAPILGGIVAGSIALTWWRLRRVEVIG